MEGRWLGTAQGQGLVSGVLSLRVGTWMPATIKREKEH